MKLDRDKAGKAFRNYVAQYNAQDEKVKLKIDHTYRVAALCEQIAQSISLSSDDVDIAWFSGLLHDVGRFEQLRRFGTFNDAQSIDHAMYGAEILFDQEKIWDYIDRDAITKDELLFLRKVISCHSAYRVPQDYTDREKQFADILRDADKIDILKVNVDVPLEEIYNVTSKDLANAEVTQAVMDSFAQKHATLRALKRTSVDHVVGHISLVYELVYPYSVKVVVQQGYLDKLMHFQSQNPHTMEQFAQLRQMMDSYIAAQILAEDIEYKTGAALEIKKVLVRNLNKKREGIAEEILTDNWKDIVEDPEIDIVIELMGGIEPARTYILEAIAAGKQVVTANKDLLAEDGRELLEASDAAGTDLLFEASVGGAIPIIRPLKQSMAGDNITEIMGIVNGTTNYILTKMSEKGMSYEDALRQATELGYAESDPTADVEGYDAGRKIAIMASLAFHSRVTFSQVYTEGITKITAEDIRYAKEFGYVIKLLGVARHGEDGIEVKVHPMLINENHPLATVRDSFNAVFVHGQAMDDAMFMGRGAGKMPTASAVMGDVIDSMRNIMHHSSGRIGCGCYRQIPVKHIKDTCSKFFMRIQAADRTGALANIASVLGNNNVSIAQVVQKSRKDGVAELVIITDEVEERHFNDALVVFQGMSDVKEVSGVIRVY